MPRRYTTPANVTPGFHLKLGDGTELGIAMLIVEDEEGHYEPIGPVATIGEGREIAAHDLKNRMSRLERGDDPGLCPYRYKVWERNIDGEYRLAAEIEP